GQPQFIERPVTSPGQPALSRTLDWARARLGAKLSVADLARRLIEQGVAPLDLVAHRSGLGTTASLRAQMRRRTGLSPSQYRTQFAQELGTYDCPIFRSIKVPQVGGWCRAACTSSPLVQAAAPVLKVGQQTSVRHVFSSVVS
ncbi:MAG TPA: hypothetical protein VN870_05660, partial [Streptosporangiaceae bacterium]|nr:hypothetical protein [Streptosporangiaceae bacterium]